ncbi:MAG: DUF47 domain-containing protein [Ancrocorticia sp.]|uniref:DUF47 domain-containing protein n=1 Tax=Ancrocorticia sp. TaxID=2593684 RepID=UPI003F937EDF
MAFKKSKSEGLFELLADQSRHLMQAADILTKIISADPQSRAELNDQLHKVEHQADEACHTVLRKVNQSFVLPFDREDLYELASVVDDCVDLMDEAGDNIVLYKPGKLPDGVNAQVEILRNCAALTHDMMGRLAVIDEKTRDFWIEINQLENQGDQVYRKMVSSLFEDATDALEVMKVKLVLDVIEDAVDAFEKLSGTIESIAIKES